MGLAVELREWVSALSGWVGAGGASIAAWLTIRAMGDQLAAAQAQVAEAKRQTDFVLGDAPPDCTVHHRIDPNRDDFGMAIVTVYNWNRRPIRITAVGSAPDSDFQVRAVGIPLAPGLGATIWSPTMQRPCPKARLPGWVDRNGGPATIEISVPAQLDPGKEGWLGIRVTGYIEDERHSTFTRDLRIAHPLIID